MVGRTLSWMTVAVTLLGAPAVAAQQPASASRGVSEPRAVAEAFFAALAAGRWREAARLMDLTHFRPYVRLQVNVARDTTIYRPPTVEDLLREDPAMPRAVAEYQVAQMSHVGSRQGEFLRREFAHVPTPDSLAALPAEEAAARWLEAQDDRYIHAELVRGLAEMCARRGLTPAVGAMRPLPPPPPRVVLGAVVRDTVAYVLHRPPRPALADDPMPDEARAAMAWHDEGPAVAELRRRAAGWRIVARENLVGARGVFGASCETPPGD